MNVINIDIREPIWAPPRSLGINIQGMDDSAVLKITCSYRTKDNNLLYPQPFKITVADVKLKHNGTTKVGTGKKVIVHKVPMHVLEVWTD